MTLAELENAKAESLKEIAAAADAAAVEALRVKYVGRNGSIPALIKGMKELRARNMRRNFADLEVERNELARVLDDLAARHNNRRDVLEGSDSRDLEELERETLRRAATASAAPRAMSGAGDLARVDGLGALVDRALHLAVFAEEDGLESRRTDVDAEVAFLFHCLTACCAGSCQRQSSEARRGRRRCADTCRGRCASSRSPGSPS